MVSVVSTHLWNTSLSLYQQAKFAGIPFIVGVAGGLLVGLFLEYKTKTRTERLNKYMGVVLKVLDLSVVFDDLWYVKMTFGES